MKDSEITEVFYQIARLLEKQAKSSKRNVDPFVGQYKLPFLLDKGGKNEPAEAGEHSGDTGHVLK